MIFLLSLNTNSNQNWLYAKTKLTTFGVKTLNTVNQFLELTVSATKHNVNIICIQEHRYYHREIEIKYNHTGNGWTFVLVSVWKNYINAIKEGVRMILCPCALKSLNSIERIQLRMMYALFNGNPT